MNIFYILISLILYVISFPKFNFWWFSFVSLVPFFLVLENAGSAFKSFLYGILWSVGFSFGMGYWVFSTILNHYEVPFASSVVFFTLCVILPIVMIYTLFSVLYRFFYQNRLIFYALVVPSIWVLAEYLKDVISFLIPWGGIDGALVPFSQFIQIGDLAGGYGIMFIAVAVNALFVYLIKQIIMLHSHQNIHGKSLDQNLSMSIVQKFRPIILISLLIFIPVLYGVHQLKKK